MELESTGRLLIIVGLIIAGMGLLFFFGSRVFPQLGSLPGDIRIQSPDGRVSCFVPIVTSIILSIVLTVGLNLVIRLINR